MDRAKDKRLPNRLVKEKSPYLQEHAYNSVGWYPWDGEALSKARNDNKPIFLSIGYSTCHWCHVMMRESFEDQRVANIINRNFIPIKVDREERPELDAYYMKAVQAMTGSGGWPLSVFLTPDLKPFYGGTYFPPESRYGMPSFTQVLEFVSKVWKERRDEAIGSSTEIAKGIEEGPRIAKGELTKSLLDEGYSSLVSSLDSEHGGFGGAPKFPLPLSIGFLLRYHRRTGSATALSAATLTLDAIAVGGIRDHIGGGFHRYATDRVWLIPHFEKMLYDNALLAKVFLEAYLVSGKKSYADAADETLGWMLKEMRDVSGGFYSAQDADTDEGEGVYYTWTPDEVEEAIGPRKEAFCSTYGVTRNGNFEGRNILHLTRGSDAGPPEIDEWKKKLYKARLARPRPATDEKILTSWNGLAISAFAYSGKVNRNPDHLQAAMEAAEYILSCHSRDGILLRRSVDGEARMEGTLEDYAFFCQGLIDLFDATSSPRLLKEAVILSKKMTQLFLDKDQGGFWLSTEEGPGKVKEDYDGPMPSGQSVAVLNLLRLGDITGDPEMRRVADETLRLLSPAMEAQPSAHLVMLGSVDLLFNGMREVVIAARTKDEGESMAAASAGIFAPETVTILATRENFDELVPLTPLVEGRRPGKLPTAYVCENSSCRLPTRDPAELRRQMSAASR